MDADYPSVVFGNVDADRRKYLEDSVMGAVPNRLPGSHYLPKGTRVYIAGPIARKPNGNREAFGLFADAARSRGWIAVNPHEVDHSHDGECTGAEVPRHATDSERVEDFSRVMTAEPVDQIHKYGCYMRADLLAMLACEAAIFMPGWPQSAGASVERQVAQICGLTIIEHYEMHEVEGGA